MTVHVHTHDECDLRWNFHDGTLGLALGRERVPYTAELDPFVCYPHAWPLVQELAARCEQVAPLPQDVRIFLPGHEGIERTNGWTWYQTATVEDDDGDKHTVIDHHIIVLSGKRVPIHPAVTRYVVAHEYGHALVQAIAYHRGEWDTDDLEREYAELRGLPAEWVGMATGGKWHTTVGEIMADDFRTIIAGHEPDFWPHPEVPHGVPGTSPLGSWWADRIQEVNGSAQDVDDAAVPA